MPTVMTAIKQTRFGQRCRAAILGRDARPLGRSARLEWRRVAAWHCQSGRLRYFEALEVATRLGLEVAAAGGVPEVTPEVERSLRERFAAELGVAAEGRPRWTSTPADRQAVAVKDALLSGRCPMCSQPLPCPDCGTKRVEIDGKGGLREID